MLFISLLEPFPIQKSSRSWLSRDKETSSAYFPAILLLVKKKFVFWV